MRIRTIDSVMNKKIYTFHFLLSLKKKVNVVTETQTCSYRSDVRIHREENLQI